MASLTRSVLGAVKTAIQGIDGTGGYSHDFSGDDQVFVSWANSPQRMTDTVFIRLAAVSSEHGARLGYYKRVMSVEIWCWVRGSNTAGDRVSEATDAADDIMTAIEADRELGLLSSGVREVIMSATTFDGQEIGIEGWGGAVIMLQVEASVRTGS